MVPWRLSTAGSIRWAVRRLLAEPQFASRAGEIAAWAADNPGDVAGASMVEALARS
jgi:hypothetical protein